MGKDLVSAFIRSKFEFPVVFKSAGEIKEYGHFSKNRVFIKLIMVFHVTLKIITIDI